jgi:endonuclease/exonuclease/phosphatase family metal-dependent hydrolase
LTHNIFGRRAGWEARRRVLRDGIGALAPDLIAFQETIVTDEYDQVVDLVADAYHVVHSRARETDGQGISIASRWSIGAVREPDLKVTPRTGNFACTTLLVEVETPEPIGPLLFVNHFPDYQPDHEHERELQTVSAARAIAAMAPSLGTHVVLAGDLDAEPDAASLRFLAGKQSLDGLSVCYRNAWDCAHPGEVGPTFTSRNPLAPPDWPFERIDHIFVRCGEQGGPTLRIVACEIVFDQPVAGVWASDHFGVLADLALPPPRAGTPA